MIKMIGLLKRRPGMSTAEFRDYYERAHRLIGEKHLAGYACRYVRRYLDPAPGRTSDGEAPYDVILEVWYPDQAAFEAAGRHLAKPDIAAEIAADEERLFDRPQNRFYLVEEVESEI